MAKIDVEVNQVGRGAVFIDGHRIPAVKSISVRAEADHAAIAVIEVYALDGINFRSSGGQRASQSGVTGESPTPAEAPQPPEAKS